MIEATRKVRKLTLKSPPAKVKILKGIGVIAAAKIAKKVSSLNMIEIFSKDSVRL